MSGGVGRRPRGRRPVLDLSPPLTPCGRVPDAPSGRRRGKPPRNLSGAKDHTGQAPLEHRPSAGRDRGGGVTPSALRSAVSTATTQITASDRTTDSPETIDLPAFAGRHIGPREEDVAGMLSTVGRSSLADLIETSVPGGIRGAEALDIEPAASEVAVLEELREVAARNRVLTSMIGLGYYGTVTPAVIQRNILENPAWYTAYTPYQPEISQGRLEALLNFQTMVADLTGLPVGWPADLPEAGAFGVLVSYPGASGAVRDHRALAEAAHAAGASVVVAAALLALAPPQAPGAWGADVACGTSQRFGVPMGYGGPHAGYLSVREGLARQLPGRLVGVSVDADGDVAYRLALQTREQHIRREKATSNTCTAQVLLAVMAGAYAVYHGPEGLAAIAARVHRSATVLAGWLRAGGLELVHEHFFDTLTVAVPGRAAEVVAAAAERRIKLRPG